MIRTSEYLHKLSEKVGYFKSEVCSILNSLEDYQLQWKPSSDSWSIVECMDHVVSFNKQYLPQLKEKVELGYSPERSPSTPYRSTYYGNMMAGAVSPDSIYKLKSSPSSQPQLKTVSEICSETESMINQSVLILEKASGCDLNNILVVSADDQMVKMPLGDKLNFLVEHQLRHLKQIKRVINHPQFPN